MSASSPRRSYGTGSLLTRRDSGGRETWYGQWRANGRVVKRRLGPTRGAGERDGLTKRQAEQELRRLIDEVEATPPRAPHARGGRPPAPQHLTMLGAGARR